VTATRVAVLAAVALAAGCGSGSEAGSRATVWITRDRGAHVLVSRSVPAGLTAMQALERVAKVDAAYGGRFVRAIDGVHSASHRDWFYYVNGYLADRGAADYRLHAGDVEWWDYRTWRNPAEDPLVVGAFPEPFLHGYDGRRRRAFVAYTQRRNARAARALARIVHGTAVFDPNGARTAARGANILELETPSVNTFAARLLGDVPGAAVVFTFGGDPMRLVRNPSLARYRYSLP
jgi:hypothetical protein